jgi:hypothetical protein
MKFDLSKCKEAMKLKKGDFPVWITVFSRVSKNGIQRSRLCAGWDFEFRLQVNVSQIVILSSNLVVCSIAFRHAGTKVK